MHLVEARKPSLALVFASLATLAGAVPDLYFPVNSQVPPVAYVSQQYAFTFSATTFGSNDSQLSYTIADGPEWLHLDTSNGSFRGTPAPSDLGANIVQLSASDSTGEVSDSITLIVLESTQLSPGASILPQLQQAGSSSAPDCLLLRPLQPFEVTFAHDTFTGIGSNTVYYAISDNRSPLPPWVQFDSSQLSFSGTAPPLVSTSTPPQTYGFLLIASDVVGFAEATVSFDIVVGYNVFAFTNVSQTVGISSGLPFQTPPLRSLLTLNGNVCADRQIASIVVDGLEWVELDKSRISLSGTPQTAVDTLVTISVTDIYNDVANTTVFLQADSLHAISLGTIGGLNVTRGENFSYTLSNPAFTDSGSISVNLGSAYGWLHFNPSNRVLSGQPPLRLPEDMIPVTIAFTNATANVTATVDLCLMPDQPNGMATASIVQSRALPQASQTSNPQNSSPTSEKTSKWSSTRMILAIVLSVLAVLIIICLILLWTLRRRRKRLANTESANLDSMQANTIDNSPSVSPPQAHPLIAPSRPLTRPPRIDLTWSNDSLAHSRYRLSGIATSGNDRTSRVSRGNGPLSRQSYIYRGPLTRQSGILDQRMVENENRLQEQARVSRIGQSATEFRTKNRGSAGFDESSAPQPTVGLPDRRSGAGHGSGILLRSDSEAARRSWRDTWTSKPVRDSRRSTVMLESFPNPPTSPGTKGDKAVLTARSTTPPIRDSIGALSFEARRQKWHTERARARLEGAARFSNAGASRLMSSPREHRTGRSRGDDRSTTLTAVQDAERPKNRPASRQRTWSDWSAIGPAAHDSFIAGSPLNSVLESLPHARTNMSLASSGQFESMTSSGSQWEDEDVVVKETANGARRWEAGESSTSSPRLPFESEGKENENSAGYAKHARISDARKRHTSVGEGSLTRSKASHHGSFRFI